MSTCAICSIPSVSAPEAPLQVCAVHREAWEASPEKAGIAPFSMEGSSPVGSLAALKGQIEGALQAHIRETTTAVLAFVERMKRELA